MISYNIVGKISLHTLSTLLVFICGAFITEADFYNDVEITWGKSHVKFMEKGQKVQLKLDPVSGAQIKSKNGYLFMKTSVMLKLIPGNSAGTITAFYLSSLWDDPEGHDEMDMEFLGNETGEPYALHTNVYVRGFGDREQRFLLWFDPTEDFHNYTIVWNAHLIVFLVDDVPLRVYRNYEDQKGVLYPRRKSMKVISSIWNCDQWATQGGRVKIQWHHSPFIATFANLTLGGCPLQHPSTIDDTYKSMMYQCWDTSSNSGWWNSFNGLSYKQRDQLKWVRDNYMVYDYCNDPRRFNFSLPIECNLPQY